MLAPYPFWLLVFFGTPLAVVWAVAYRHLIRYRYIFLEIGVLCIIPGVIWDVFAAETGIWYWPASCCVLPRLGSIPYEEIFFMVFGGIYIATLTILVRDIVKKHRKLRKGAHR